MRQGSQPEWASRAPGTIRYALGIVCLLGAIGCTAGADSADAGTLEVELGTGTTAFVPLATESDLVLVAGPQGGHHFIVHGRARDIVPGDPSRPGGTDNPATWFRAYSENGDRLDLDYPPYRLGFVGGDDGWFELPSGRILQVEEVLVPSLYGARVRLVLEITDSTGASGTSERWVTAIEDPDPKEGDGGSSPVNGGPSDAGVKDAGP